MSKAFQDMNWTATELGVVVVLCFNNCKPSKVAGSRATYKCNFLNNMVA